MVEAIAVERLLVTGGAFGGSPIREKAAGRAYGMQHAAGRNMSRPRSLSLEVL